MRVLGPSLSRTFKNKYFRAEYSSISYLEGSPAHHGCWWKLMILHVGCIQLRHQTCSVELCQGRSSRCPYQGETPILYHIYLGLVEDLKCTNIMRIHLYFLYTLPIKQQKKNSRNKNDDRNNWEKATTINYAIIYNLKAIQHKTFGQKVKVSIQIHLHITNNILFRSQY